MYNTNMHMENKTPCEQQRQNEDFDASENQTRF